MEAIPKKGTPEREAMIKEHLECTESMKGVPGFTVLKCAEPGDTTEVSGGFREDPVMRRVLLRMRGQMPALGKLVIICTEVEKEWRIARLSGVRGVPPEFVDDRVFDNEQDVQHAIFLMRLDELPETDGMPEDFHEGWKRRSDGWVVT